MRKDNEKSRMSLAELIEKKEWTKILDQLEADKTYVFMLQSQQAIHSFKSVAYKINSFRLGKRYSVKANNETGMVEVVTTKTV